MDPFNDYFFEEIDDLCATIPIFLDESSFYSPYGQDSHLWDSVFPVNTPEDPKSLTISEIDEESLVSTPPVSLSTLPYRQGPLLPFLEYIPIPIMPCILLQAPTFYTDTPFLKSSRGKKNLIIIVEPPPTETVCEELEMIQLRINEKTETKRKRKPTKNNKKKRRDTTPIMDYIVNALKINNSSTRMVLHNGLILYDQNKFLQYYVSTKKEVQYWGTKQSSLSQIKSSKKEENEERRKREEKKKLFTRKNYFPKKECRKNIQVFQIARGKSYHR